MEGRQARIDSRTLCISASAFLVLALLGYSAIFFILNLTRNPSVIAGNSAWISQRFFWLKVRERWCVVCMTVYLMKNIFLLLRLAKRTLDVSFKKLALYVLAQAGLALLTTVPFGLLDRRFFADYLFPLYGLGAALAFLFLAAAAILLFRRVRSRKRSHS